MSGGTRPNTQTLARDADSAITLLEGWPIRYPLFVTKAVRRQLYTGYNQGRCLLDDKVAFIKSKNMGGGLWKVWLADRPEDENEAF